MEEYLFFQTRPCWPCGFGSRTTSSPCAVRGNHVLPSGLGYWRQNSTGRSCVGHVGLVYGPPQVPAKTVVPFFLTSGKLPLLIGLGAIVDQEAVFCVVLYV